MGEMDCMLESVSQFDGSSVEAREGDPVRALGQSISFGRFMSESLAWEKWSTFSHNRYLEEAEKISKPGSVAQKKAYFEAHYKKIAAKKAAALVEDVNVATNKIPEASTSTPGEVCDNIHVATIAQENEDTPEVLLLADANGCSSNVEGNRLDSLKVEGSDVIIEEGLNVENSTSDETSNHLKNFEEKDEIVVVREGKMPDKELVVPENLYSKRKKTEGDSSSKSSILGRPSKLLHESPAKQTTSIQHQNVNNATTSSKKPSEESVYKKRLTPKSLHMSINFASRAGETRKTSPVFQQNANKRIHTASCKFSKESSTSSKMSVDSSTTSKMSKDSPSTLRIPARASVNGFPKRPSVTSQPDDKRMKTADRKWSTLSTDHSKSSSASGSKGRSPIVISPFSFKSEERAAKRKEFFQKLAEKTSSKEPERVRRQERSKIPLTQPRSPKLGRKPIANTAPDTFSKPPRRPSVNTTDSSKRLTGKNQITMQSVSSLPKKNTGENSSPNIQH